MKRIIMYAILLFVVFVPLTACDALEHDNIAANIDLSRDPAELAHAAYSALLDSLHFVNIREGAAGLEYHLNFYEHMEFSGRIDVAYKERELDFRMTMELDDYDHVIFMHVFAVDGEIVYADACEYGGLLIYMAAGEQMYEMVWGDSQIPFVMLPEADADAFTNVRFERDGDYLTMFFTLEDADMRADVALVLQFGVIPRNISIDWPQNWIAEYDFHYFAGTVIFESRPWEVMQ